MSPLSLSFGFFLGVLLISVTLVSLVRSVQALTHFGWFSEKGAVWWFGLAGGAFSGYYAYRSLAALPVSLAVPAAVLALGIGLLILARMTPRWLIHEHRGHRVKAG